MNILITGGVGFIGSHLSEKLLRIGYNIICIDNLDNYIYTSETKKENLVLLSNYSNFYFVEGDIRNQELVHDILIKFNCELVVHLAAYAGVRLSVSNPEKFMDVNINGTVSVFEAMRRAKVYKMVMASSSSVYGNSTSSCFKEIDSADLPLSPYAVSKRTAELLAYSYHKMHGFEITCLRLFTVFGPRQRPEMAIRKFIENIVAGFPIELYGDGNASRNYTYIDDVTEGFLKAIDRNQGYEVINIAGKESVRLKDLIQTLEYILNKKAIVNFKEEQVGDMYQTIADITKAKKILDYTPKVSFKDGIKYVIESIITSK